MNRLISVVAQAGMWLAAFISVFPFLWMVTGATNTANDITGGRFLPGTNLFVNIAKFFELVDAGRVFFNSFFVAITGTALTLVVSSLAGYGFEIFASKARDRVFAGLLLLLSVPFAAMMIPLFVMFSGAGLINTYIAMIAPGVASIFMIFYFRQNTKSFPHELRDAAKLDGLKEHQIFWFIYIPVMRSTYAAAMIILFMTNWNAYLWPLIVLQTNEMKTITLTVASLATAYTPDYGLIMIANVLATLPTVLVFFLLQRRFVEGMLGGVK
ncbi:carbohydrate ABC transporter permease [Rhodobacter sp. KR11]|jgi:lactose/L-arabinose transport system permease protein|uniref:carbohydrate ABC transporter permease n=1 Tax=Rhodobacter sp. KR11 TaxID=2974588 RepID=UPI00222229FE|nr:carbohydrate ABC transporter permease [Rhodobacter sp. KR11]MCW1917563.1 carbohydrate ABC transporter permease [Rhodobacter sp. KR11]